MNNLTKKSKIALMIYFISLSIEIVIATLLQTCSIEFLSNVPFATTASATVIIILIIIANIFKLFFLAVIIWSENTWRKIRHKFGKSYE